jgi:hypothetical protein
MSQEDPKEQLIRSLCEIEEAGKDVIKSAGEFVEMGQEAVDFAGAARGIIECYPSTAIRQEQLVATENQKADLYHVRSAMREISFAVANASSMATSYEMTPLTDWAVISLHVPRDKQSEARAKAEKLREVIERSAKKDRVLELMRKFGLDQASPGKKSPSEQFKTAWTAFQRPLIQDSPITSLIPIRQCINDAIAALLRRRPKQEAAKRPDDKIRSICAQLSWDISDERIESLAKRWKPLKKELSSAKQDDLRREESGSLLLRATLFIRELLLYLDPKKLKE